MDSLKNDFNAKVQIELLKRQFKVIFSDFPKENHQEFNNNEAPDFHQLRNNLLQNNSLFEDPDFPATDTSLYYTEKSRNCVWLRPKEIVSDPEFVIDGVSRFDIRQGEISNCWFLAALACLTTNKTVFDWIIPRDQGFKDKYCGIFHFKLWQYGRWVDVVIDDRLPTKNKRLHFTHSHNSKEFWTALLEKAYAKLHGSYEALIGGHGFEALEDFTGGLSEFFPLSSTLTTNLRKDVPKYYEMRSMMTCNTARTSNHEIEQINGLVSNHEYSITRITTILKDDHQLLLLRLRNPWGEREWKGSWSDRSSEWDTLISEEQKNENLISDDGEFWISFEDFIKEFSWLKICHLHPNLLQKLSNHNKWNIAIAEGEWVRGVSSGGKNTSLDEFYHNPQFIFLLEKTSDDSETHRVIIALMQNHTRAMKHIGKKWLSIGFNVYKLTNMNPSVRLNKETILKCENIQIPAIALTREITGRVDLQPGSYCIIPWAGKANTEGEFVLRIASENVVILRELDQEQVAYHYDEIDSPTDIKTENINKEEFQEFLKKFNTELDANELKEILNYAMKTGGSKPNEFTLEACSDIMNAFNRKSDTINIDQIVKLWSDIIFLMHVFELYEENNSGFLKPFSFKAALNAAGFKINIRVLNLLAHRYATKDGKVAFDNFIACLIRLRKPEHELRR